MDVAGGWKGKKERTSPLPVYLRSRRPRVHFQRSVWQTGRKKGAPGPTEEISDE